MPIIKIPTAFNIDLEFEGADLGRRLVAYFIDLLIRVAYMILVGMLISKNISDSGTESVLTFIFLVIPVSLYYLISEIIMKGQSLGKRAMDIKVVSLLGNTPSISQILLRWMFRLVESPIFTLALIITMSEEASALTILVSLAVGIIPIVIVFRSPYNQRLGDIAAGTIIVRTHQRHSIQDTIFREIDQVDYVPQFSQILRLSDKDLSKIKSVLDTSMRTNNWEMAGRMSEKIKSVLHIETDMEPSTFLETLLNDYNYLVTRK